MLANRTLQSASMYGGYQIQRSLRFRALASAYVNRSVTSSSANQTKNTISFWFKRGQLGTAQVFYQCGPDGGNYTSVSLTSANQLQLYSILGSTGRIDTTWAPVLRDPSAWYHIVISIDTTQAVAVNRAILYLNGIAYPAVSPPALNDFIPITYWTGTWVSRIGSISYSVSNLFDGYLAEFNLIEGLQIAGTSFGQIDPNTGVWSAKRYAGTYSANGFCLNFSNATGTIILTDSVSAIVTAPFGGSPATVKIADSVYMTTNTSVGSSFDAVKYDFGQPLQLSRYLIGALYFTGGVSTFEVQISNDDSTYATVATLSVTASGANFSGNLQVSARYLKLRATAFGTNGQAVIDCLLVYQDTLGLDSSPNGNVWIPNSISVTPGSTYDSMLDVPLGGGGSERGNYCTLNPLDNIDPVYAGAQNGNLRGNLGTGVATYLHGTQGIRNMKVYYECRVESVGNGTTLGVSGGENAIANIAPTGVFYSLAGTKRVAGVDTTYGATFGNNDNIGVAVDGINGTIEFFKNNVSQGVITSSLISSNTVFPYHWNNSSSGLSIVDFNFGQCPFTYTPPTGFKALHTGNFPAPSIRKPNQYFDTTIYTGDGAATKTISGVNFQSDLIWVKTRNAATNHQLQDSVRGFNLALASSTTQAEGDNGTLGIKNVTRGGFDVGAGSAYNANTVTYVAWLWKRGVIPGFDIVTYSGDGSSNRLIAHGLGVTPKFYITKNRDGYNNSQGFTDWGTYHESLPSHNSGLGRQNVWLHSTLAPSGGAGGINLIPTPSVFTPIVQLYDNVVGRTYVAYLFAEIAGFSKFGSYTGNGSINGPLVYCGFRPEFIMLKRTDSTSDWYIHDALRDTHNFTIKNLFPNLSAAENAGELESTYGIDFVSNGFKIRASHPTRNASGGTYIFIAFAEVPFKYALAR